MKTSKRFLALFSVVLLFLWLMPDNTEAQDGNSVALVVRMKDQEVRTACVEFAEPQISGLEALQRSGIDFKIDVQSMGAKICSIEQTGCPVDDCWCQCKGGEDCIYWSYWHRLEDQWRYSQGGASTYAVSDGDVEGWSWGPGSVSEAIAPPDLSYSDICRSQPAEAVIAGGGLAAVVHDGMKKRVPPETETAPESEIIGSAYQIVDLSTAEISSETSLITAAEEKIAAAPVSYAAFGLIVLILVGLLLFSTVRRQARLS